MTRTKLSKPTKRSNPNSPKQPNRRRRTCPQKITKISLDVAPRTSTNPINKIQQVSSNSNIISKIPSHAPISRQDRSRQTSLTPISDISRLFENVSAANNNQWVNINSVRQVKLTKNIRIFLRRNLKAFLNRKNKVCGYKGRDRLVVKRGFMVCVDPATKSRNERYTNFLGEIQAIYTKHHKSKSTNIQLALERRQAFILDIEKARLDNNINQSQAASCLMPPISRRAYRIAVFRANRKVKLQGRPKSKYGQQIENLYKEFSTERKDAHSYDKFSKMTRRVMDLPLRVVFRILKNRNENQPLGFDLGSYRRFCRNRPKYISLHKQSFRRLVCGQHYNWNLLMTALKLNGEDIISRMRELLLGFKVHILNICQILNIFKYFNVRFDMYMIF